VTLATINEPITDRPGLADTGIAAIIGSNTVVIDTATNRHLNFRNDLIDLKQVL
jgi:hypothetical protein